MAVPNISQRKIIKPKFLSFTLKEVIGYAFEFVLVFLAVFAGFIAENFRERQAESSRERSYMNMLIKDLHDDIYRLDSNTQFRLAREKSMDTLMQLLSTANRANQYELYVRALEIDGYETFFRNDRTIIQFKNAGGMSMIRNDSVSAAIMDYDSYIISEIDWNNNIEARRTEYYKELRFQAFDAQAMHQIRHSLPFLLPVKLMSTDQKILNPIAGSVFQMIRISATNRDCSATVKEKALNLIKLIRRQYNLNE